MALSTSGFSTHKIMSEFKNSQRQEQLSPIIKRYKEEGRHGETFTAERKPLPNRLDDTMRIHRKDGGRPR